ncbi:hypothetical protein A2U01_0046325, partial [Trifolium medium]|nr:hypothetical protein [Trifolium medium]
VQERFQVLKKRKDIGAFTEKEVQPAFQIRSAVDL